MERRRLQLRRGRVAEELRGGCLIEPRLDAALAHSLEQADGSESRHLRRVFGHVEGNADVGLRSQVVDLVWLHRAQNAIERRAVVEIAINEIEPPIRIVWILVDRIDAARIE